MKSRITVEIDYENNNQPVIQIISKNSDDVRDGLIKAFYQKLGGSSWLKIRFNGGQFDPTLATDDERNFYRIFITPIPEEELGKEAVIMAEQYRLKMDWIESLPIQKAEK